MQRLRGLQEVKKYGLFRVEGQEKMKKKTTKNIKKTHEDKFDEFFMNTDFSRSGIEPVLIKTSERKGGRPKIGRKLSIVLPEELIKQLQIAGKMKGVGYQTMIRIICSENVDEYVHPR